MTAQKPPRKEPDSFIAYGRFRIPAPEPPEPLTEEQENEILLGLTKLAAAQSKGAKKD